MHSVKRPTWQQATALVSLSTCGAMTGFTFAHGTVADVTSPTSMPVHLMALDKPAPPTSSSDSALRSAIVSVAKLLPADGAEQDASRNGGAYLAG